MSCFPLSRRACLAAVVILPLSPALSWAARPGLASASQQAMAAFDGLYIPALFLTGSAGKSAEGAAKAVAAMNRLSAQWPARRVALGAAAPGQRAWRRALDAVGALIGQADAQVARARWPESHDTLEQVRETLFEARHALGIVYALDPLTAFHGAMEKIANATTVQRNAMEADFVTVRALWRGIETLDIVAADHGLSAARAAQWAKARDEETAALSRLSQALRQASDAELLKAAGAIKPPFIRAYTAFGWGPDESPLGVT